MNEVFWQSVIVLGLIYALSDWEEAALGDRCV